MFACRLDYIEMKKRIEFDIDSDGTVSDEEAKVSSDDVKWYD